MNIENLKKTKTEKKKITTVYLNPEYKKFLDARGFNISKTIDKLLEQFIEQLKKDEKNGK